MRMLLKRRLTCGMRGQNERCRDCIYGERDENDHMKDNERVLKKCPFCGGYARFCEDMRFHEKKDSFPKWYVMCVGCNIRTPVADRTLVMKMWNERAE